MLKYRVLTAAVLIPIIVWLVLAAPAKGFQFLTLVFLLLAALEWSSLSGWTTKKQQMVFLVFTLLVLVLLSLLPIFWVLTLNVILSIWAFYAVIIYAKRKTLKLMNVTSVKLALGMLILNGAWLSIQELRYMLSPFWLMYLLVLVWAADSGAYFSGKKWGQHFLAPQVSPKKTWEGVWGGMACAVIIMVLGIIFLQVPMKGVAPLVLISILTVIFSIVGDLFESLL